jgi:hypothetical protein
MESISVETTTAQYVQRFFSDFIEHVFIGDYRELRTREHPLSRRPQIIRRVEALHGSESHRTRLIGWYLAKRCPGDPRKAERLFERDIQRLLELQRIDEYLDRLDDEIRRANKRALAYLDYRLRSMRPIDHLVAHAIRTVLKTPRAAQGGPFASGELMAAGRLAEPRKARDRAAPSFLRQQQPSPEEIARARLMLRVRDARTVTSPKLAEFVRRQLDGRYGADSADLTLESVADVRAYQTLSVVAMAMNANSRRLAMSARTNAGGFDVLRDGTEELQGPLISIVPFRIELRKKAGLASESSS